MLKLSPFQIKSRLRLPSAATRAGTPAATPTRSNVRFRGAFAVASVLAVLPTIVGGGSAGPTVDEWVTRANAICRPRTSSYENLTPPSSVATGQLDSTADARAAGDFYAQLARLYQAVTTGLRAIHAPPDDATSASAIVAATTAAANAANATFVESRDPRLQFPRDASKLAQQIRKADSKAAAAGQATQDLTIVECLLLFGGDQADHANLPKATPGGPPCWTDPNYNNESTINAQPMSCSDPHGFETYGTTSYPVGVDHAYPGDDQVGRAGDILCATRFKAFVGIDPAVSSLASDPVTASADDWNAGSYSIDCILHDKYDAPLVGSMLNSRR